MRKIIWTPEMENLLGSATDKEVAPQLGISEYAVGRRRRALEIPSVPRARRPIAWTPEMDALLGIMKDKDVADQLGISKFPAGERRRELGIPSWKSRNRVIPEDVSHLSTEAYRIYGARSRERKQGLKDTLTYEQWRFACEWFEDKCAYCGEEAFLTEDHLVPSSKGGPRVVLNIIPACWECNYSKRAKRAHLWIYEHFGVEQGKIVVDRIVAYLVEAMRQA